MDRRFNKKVYTKSGAIWSLQTTKNFVCDGYKQIAEYAGTTATMLTVWQPESSGDFDVPLWSKTGTEVQTYIVDGNKNVRQLKNAAGTVIANYDYAPFGNVTSTGTPSPWQFSSEYRDAETNLIYYNYRYYAPTIGRWLTRDPITEQGGVNLYAFVNNHVETEVDHLGQAIGILGTNPANPFDVSPWFIQKRLYDDYTPSGVKICSALSDSYYIRHVWLESTFGSIDVVAGSVNIFFSDGIISDASSYSGRADKRCIEVMLPTCCLKKERLEQWQKSYEQTVRSYKNGLNWVYGVIGGNCADFVDKIIGIADSTLPCHISRTSSQLYIFIPAG